MTAPTPNEMTVENAEPAQSRPQFSFVVPCYNEEPNLAGTVEEIEACARDAGISSFEIVMIDDCSRDETAARIRELAEVKSNVRPVFNARNLGLGGAYKAGVTAASGIHVMMVPGDNAHPAHGMTPIVAAVGESDMVVPFVTNPEVRGPMRRLASWGFVTLMNGLFGLKVPYYNGLVVHRLDLLREIEIETNSFAYQAEAIVKLLKRGATFNTVGVEINTREHGGSKAFRASNVVNVLRALWDLKRRVG